MKRRLRLPSADSRQLDSHDSPEYLAERVEKMVAGSKQLTANSRDIVNASKKRMAESRKLIAIQHRVKRPE